MARYSIDGQILTEMAEAIRSKTTMTEIKTAFITKKVYKTPNATAPGVYLTITENDPFYNDDYEYHVFTIPGATKIQVDYDVLNNMLLGFSLFIEVGNTTEVTDYAGNLSSYGVHNVGSRTYEGTDTITIIMRNREFSRWQNSNSGFYLEIMGFAADDSPIVLDDDPNPGELQYEGLHDMTPAEMVEEIKNILPGPSDDDLIIRGDCDYRFKNDRMTWYFNKYGEMITTESIAALDQAFSNSPKLTSIPFAINGDGSNLNNMPAMFQNCTALVTAPEMYNMRPNATSSMFYNCNKLEGFPEGFAEDWDWTYMETYTSEYGCSQSGMFNSCFVLRHIPTALITHCNPCVGTYYNLFQDSFNYCYCLEELNGLCVPHKANWSYNVFTNLQYANRLKDFTFRVQDDGTPYICNGWKSQVIDLTRAGYGSGCATYDTRFTINTKIVESARWEQAISGQLDDYWTDDVTWSVYDRRAAVRTINSLPDVSGSGSTNTIKFANSGANSCGTYAVANLSQEEIAVAVAKGWTVTFV